MSATNCLIKDVPDHYDDVIMSAIASQITSLTIVYSNVCSDEDQRKHQSSASLAFVRGIHRGPVNSPHKWPVTREMFPFDDVIMCVLLGFCGLCVISATTVLINKNIPNKCLSAECKRVQVFNWSTSWSTHFAEWFDEERICNTNPKFCSSHIPFWITILSLNTQKQ